MSMCRCSNITNVISRSTVAVEAAYGRTRASFKCAHVMPESNNKTTTNNAADRTEAVVVVMVAGRAHDGTKQSSQINGRLRTMR